MTNDGEAIIQGDPGWEIPLQHPDPVSLEPARCFSCDWFGQAELYWQDTKRSLCASCAADERLVLLQCARPA